MGSSLKRETVSDLLKWSTEDIMSESDLNKYFQDIEAGCAEILKFKGQLNVSNALECLLIRSKISYKLEKAYVYTHLKSDENKADVYYQELSEKADYYAVNFDTACSFIDPAFASFKNSELIKMKNDEKYSYFSMYIDSVIRTKKHLLSEKEEAILSASHVFSDDFKTIFSMFDNINVNLGEVEIDGEVRKLSHGLYSVCLQNKDPEVRKSAYESLYKGYESMLNTLAANYAGNVKKDIFYSKARKFNSCLDMALYSENIPRKVYSNLIEEVDKHCELMHQYVAYRKKTLKLEKMFMYDMYMPLAENIEKTIPYDEAYEQVCEALAPMGKDYVDILLRAKRERWLDVEETENKRSGAYSWGVYGTHPFVLLNHKGTTHDMFTIAHEMGHAMHSYYSNGAQCYEKSAYCIFLAEIASTVNEVLLIKHKLKSAEKEERKYLLAYYADMIRTTLFRQTMFAEFEVFAHECAENGEALTAERMSNLYAELNRKYYGDAVVTDKYISYEWSRIPHFYTSFYVYKYATGIICAINIANKILSDASFVNKYKEFMKSGGSDYPVEALKLVDIDLTKKYPFTIAMKEFKTVLSELNRL